MWAATIYSDRVSSLRTNVSAGQSQHNHFNYISVSVSVCLLGCVGVCARICMCDCVCDPAQATAGPQPWLQHGQHWWSQDALAAFTKVGRDGVTRPPSSQQSHLLMPCLSQDRPKSTPVGMFGETAWWRGWVGWAGLRDSFAFDSVPRFFLGFLHYVIRSV